eukprot:COSAG06_NODE_1063_length_10870_cov_236.460217_5_plen_53_part_00
MRSCARCKSFFVSQGLAIELTFMRVLPFTPPWVINVAAPVRPCAVPHAQDAS